MEKKFPDHMVPLEKRRFTFHCHPGLSCYTLCCKNVEMFLFPYDIIRLKNRLGLDSTSFLRDHTLLKEGGNLFFPSVMMKLTQENSCPFLTADGCSVYEDRPSSCRTYPLERAVDRNPEKNSPQDFYFLTHHPYCLGHGEDMSYSVKEWVRNQKIERFNVMNDLWAELEAVFAKNPWKGEGRGGPKQQLAFMVCYNIDAFRTFVSTNGLLRKFRLSGTQRRSMETDDSELLKFGLQWLKLLLTGKSNLLPKE